MTNGRLTTDLKEAAKQGSIHSALREPFLPRLLSMKGATSAGSQYCSSTPAKSAESMRSFSLRASHISSLRDLQGGDEEGELSNPIGGIEGESEASVSVRLS